jgi:hypothetical protein
MERQVCEESKTKTCFSKAQLYYRKAPYEKYNAKTI